MMKFLGVPQSSSAMLLLLLLTGCASKPPAIAPRWDEVPPFITNALCQRLRMDALATGSVTIVGTTQPLATADVVGALASTGKRSQPLDIGPLTNRAIPIRIEHSSCMWRVLTALDRKPKDQMIVELSAPMLNPWADGEAGVLARASLGGEHASWYWIALVPGKSGDTWRVRFVSVLPL
jgi:hypothetical protein